VPFAGGASFGDGCELGACGSAGGCELGACEPAGGCELGAAFVPAIMWSAGVMPGAVMVDGCAAFVPAILCAAGVMPGAVMDDGALAPAREAFGLEVAGPFPSEPPPAGGAAGASGADVERVSGEPEHAARACIVAAAEMT
jgi:hypothetical protein